MKRVLIIEPNWLGDVLFTTPAIKAIKEKSRNCHIAVVVHRRCIPILEDNPNIDELIILNTGRGLVGLFEKIKLIPYLKTKKFNSVFLFSRSMSHVLMCALSGISERIGYHTIKRSFLLTHKVKQPKQPLHKVEHFLGILREVGIDTDNKDYDFFIKEQQEGEAQRLLNENEIFGADSYFVLNPGGNWAPKRWPKESFAKLADALYDKTNTKVVITGAEKDIKLGEEIAALCKTRPVNLCGKTTLKTLAAVLKNAKIVISNDSGPMHIAVSQKTPTIALFGPTDPAITGPYGSSKYTVVRKSTDCPVPCYDDTCKEYHCMEAISVEDVMEAVEKLLNA